MVSINRANNYILFTSMFYFDKGRFWYIWLYSRTSQDGHPLGNAKVSVLWRWPSYGGPLFNNNRTHQEGLKR